VLYVMTMNDLILSHKKYFRSNLEANKMQNKKPASAEFSKLSYLSNLTATPIKANTTPIIHARIVTLYDGQPKASKW